MNYEKKYNEALERAKELLLGNEHSNTIRSYFEHIFPELVESDDERIRKRIKSIIYHNDALLDKDELLAWLEKKKVNTEETLGEGMIVDTKQDMLLL